MSMEKETGDACVRRPPWPLMKSEGCLRTDEVGCSRRRAAGPDAALGGLRMGGRDGEAGAGRAGSRGERAGHAARQAEAGEAGAGPAGQVRVGIDEIRLFRGGGVAGVRLDAGVEAARAIGGELRDGDGGEDADDRDYDQQFDEGETFRLLLLHLGALAAHASSLFSDGCWSVPDRPTRSGRSKAGATDRKAVPRGGKAHVTSGERQESDDPLSR